MISFLNSANYFAILLEILKVLLDTTNIEFKFKIVFQSILIYYHF